MGYRALMREEEKEESRARTDHVEHFLKERKGKGGEKMSAQRRRVRVEYCQTFFF